MSRGRSRSVLGMLLCVLVASVAACSSEEVSSVASAPASDITWLPCGDIECGQIQIPVDHSAASSEKFTLGLYRRTSSVSNDARTLILVPDKKWSTSARDMVEAAVLTYGPRINSFKFSESLSESQAERVSLTLPLSSSDRKLELTSNLLTELPSDIFGDLAQLKYYISCFCALYLLFLGQKKLFRW